MANKNTGRNSKVDTLLRKASWQKERRKLRSILIDCQLTETVKWGKLCYTVDDRNVAMIIGLKDYCAIGFFKGSLLRRASSILAKPGPNSQAMRQLRFTSLQQIREMESTARACVLEAIEVEKAGLQVNFEEKNNLVLAEEFQAALENDAALESAFEALTPGRRRGYNLYFSSARQSRTRLSRVEKCKPRILAGKGLNDR